VKRKAVSFQRPTLWCKMPGRPIFKLLQNPRPPFLVFPRAHDEAGESMSALGRLCGFGHTSVREAIERAREKRDEGH